MSSWWSGVRANIAGPASSLPFYLPGLHRRQLNLERKNANGELAVIAVADLALPSHQLTWFGAQTPVERRLSSWLVGLFALPVGWRVSERYPKMVGE